MKNKLQSVMCSLALVSGLLIAVPAAKAEGNEGGERPKKERHEAGPNQRIQALREKLALTDAQVEQLTPIFEAERQEVAAKRKELGKDADREKVREAMRGIHEKYIPKIEAVLTPEQREKWAKMRERRSGGPGGSSGHGGPGGEGSKSDGA